MALITVLMVAAVSSAVAITLLTLSITGSRSNLVSNQALTAKSLANACAETALQKLNDAGNSDSGALSIGSASCAYTLEVFTPSTARIIASGTAGSVVRFIDIYIDSIVPQIHVSSWREVANRPT